MTYTLISHFYNEEFLLPHFIRHHLPIFDHGVLIDYGSTDHSVEIVRELAPNWEVRPSEYGEFDSRNLDYQVMTVEQEFPGWKFALNVTEFLMCADMRDRLKRWDEEGVRCVSIQSVVMVDRPGDRPLQIDPNVPLHLQCHYGYVDEEMRTRRCRYTHSHENGAYHHGRHGTGHNHIHDEVPLLFWYGWSPFDQVKDRKLQIQTKMSQADKHLGYGREHLVNEDQLEAEWERHASMSYELTTHPRYANALFPYLKESP